MPAKNTGKTDKTPQGLEVSLPPNAVELKPATVGVTLQPGQKYAIKDSTKYEDDPQNILTEDMFRSAVPDGFYTVQAVGARHYVHIDYTVTQNVDSDDITGFAPEFNVQEALPTNTARTRLRKAFADPNSDPLLVRRAQTLRNTNDVMAAHLQMNDKVKEGPTDSGFSEPAGNSLIGNKVPTDTVTEL